MTRQWNGLGLAVLLVCGAPFFAQAQAADKIDFQVLVIRATTKNKTIDKELKPLANEMNPFNFTGYKLEKTLRGSAEMNKAFSSKLPGGYEVSLTPTDRSGNHISLTLSVTRTVDGKKRLVNRFKMKLTAGKTVLNGGWPLEGGDRQMLAISAR